MILYLLWSDYNSITSVYFVASHDVTPPTTRYEKMAEQEELNYQQQRRRLFGEVAQEKEKLAEQLLREKTKYDLQLKETFDLHSRSGKLCTNEMS